MLLERRKDWFQEWLDAAKAWSNVHDAETLDPEEMRQLRESLERRMEEAARSFSDVQSALHALPPPLPRKAG